LSKKRRQSKIPTPAWEREHGRIGGTLAGRSSQFYLTAGIIALVVLALGIVAYAVISDEIADANRPGSTALQVGDRDFSLEYFTNRVNQYVQQNGGPGVIGIEQATTAIDGTEAQIVEEQLLLQYAQEKEISATDDEINDEIATRMGITKDDPAFATRVQEELDRSGMSEEEFREVARGAVLRRKLIEKYTSEVPANAEQIHYRQILVETQAEADEIRSQIEAGADFAALAKERSLDTSNKENGGDAGWAPRGVGDKGVEDHLFAQEINKVTTYPVPGNVYVFQVIERSPDRALDEEQKTFLAEKNYGTWLEEKQGGVTVEEFDFSNADNSKYLADRVWPAA
jgi:parvulin-like peptidyl-prolyl isomerase